MADKFEECNSCKAKPGFIDLCPSCIERREAIRSASGHYLTPGPWVSAKPTQDVINWSVEITDDMPAEAVAWLLSYTKRHPDRVKLNEVQ